MGSLAEKISKNKKFILSIFVYNPLSEEDKNKLSEKKI